MQKVFEGLTRAFRKNDGIIDKERFDTIVYKYTTLFERSDTIYHLLKVSGYPIDVIDGGYRYAPYFNDYKSDLYLHSHWPEGTCLASAVIDNFYNQCS